VSDDPQGPPFDPLAFVARHGVVLVWGRGPAPRLSEAIAGGPIRGSWWAHAQGKAIFDALQVLADAPDVLFCKLVEGRQTLVHRRLWPALARCGAAFPGDRVARVRQEHTGAGAHRNVETAFPEWLPAEVKEAAGALSEDAAWAELAAAGVSRCG
jgi:hypothetical protein